MIYAKEAILVDGKHHDIGDEIKTDKDTADMLLRLRRATKEAPAKTGGKAKTGGAGGSDTTGGEG